MHQIHTQATKSRKIARRGAAIVEAALVLPVFFLAILGIVEFGRALTVSNMLTQSARGGARLAVVDGSTNAEVETYVRNLCQNTLGVAPADVAITISIQPHPSNNTAGNEVAAAQNRDIIDVLVQVPFDNVALIAGKYLSGKNLSGFASMPHE